MGTKRNLTFVHKKSLVFIYNVYQLYIVIDMIENVFYYAVKTKRNQKICCAEKTKSLNFRPMFICFFHTAVFLTFPF